MMWTNAGLGRVFAGEADVIIRPTNYGPAKAGVIYVHGAEGEPGGGLTWMKVPERIPLLRAIAAAGHSIISADLGGVATWGNDTALSRISAARTYLQSLAGVTAGRVILVGQSMGGQNSLVWAKNNPTLVHCVVAIIPVIDLADIHDNRGLGASIDSAYAGGYNQATMGAARNPATFAAAGALNGIPIQCWYGATDTLCLPGFTEVFATKADDCELHSLPGGHAEATAGAVDPAAVLAFLRANTA